MMTLGERGPLALSTEQRLCLKQNESIPIGLCKSSYEPQGTTTLCDRTSDLHLYQPGLSPSGTLLTNVQHYTVLQDGSPPQRTGLLPERETTSDILELVRKFTSHDRTVKGNQMMEQVVYKWISQGTRRPDLYGYKNNFQDLMYLCPF